MGRTNGTGRTGTRLRRAIAIGALTAIGLAACSGDDDDGSALLSEEATELTIAASEDVGSDSHGESGGSDDAARAPATAGSNAPSAPIDVTQGVLTDRDLAVEAGVVFGTSNVRDAVDDALVAVRASGGTVFSADVNLGDESTNDEGVTLVEGSGQIVVKILPGQLDALIDALDDGVGELLSRTQAAEDVTAQLVDLELRIEVERTAIEQFRGLLAEATELDDIVRIQDLISERTVRLEQLLANERNLDARVAQSTLTIEIVYQAPEELDEAVLASPDEGIADAFADGWDAFAGAMFAIAFVLAVSAPFLAVLAVIGVVAWFVVRPRLRMPAPHETRSRRDGDGGLTAPTSDDEPAAPSPTG